MVGSIWLFLIAILVGNTSIFTVGIIGLTFVSHMLHIYDKKNALQMLSTAALSLGFLSMLVLYFGLQIKYGRPYYMGGSDDLQFEIIAQKLVNEKIYLPEQMPITYSGYNAKGFVCILANLIRLCNYMGGYHTITFRVLNIELLVLLATLVFRLVFMRSGNGVVARKAFAFIAFFPNSIFLSSFVFRDTLNIVLLFLCIVAWCDFAVTHKIINAVIITIFCGYWSFWIRSQNLWILIAMAMCIALIGQSKPDTKKKFLFLALVCAVVFMLPQLKIIESILEINERYTKNYFSYSNSGLSRIVFSLPLFPFGFLVRMIYAIISPIPTGIMGIFNIGDIDVFANFLISCGTIYQIYQLPYLAKGILKLDDIDLCFLVIWFVVSATTFTFRHFIMLYPFMAYIVVKQKEEDYTNYIGVMTMAVVLLGGLYMILGL